MPRSGFAARTVMANDRPCTMVLDREGYSDGNMQVNAEASRILTATVKASGVKVFSRLIVRGPAILFNCVIPHVDGTEG